MRVIIAETKKIDWNLNPAQYRLEPDEGDPNAVQVTVIFEQDPTSPANVQVKQIIRKSTGEDLLPSLGRFNLPQLERSISEKVATQGINNNDPFWQSDIGSDLGGDRSDTGKPDWGQSFDLGRM